MDNQATTGSVDRSKTIQVIIWFLFLAAAFGVGARLGTKWAMARKMALEDAFIIVAQVSYLGHGVAISIAASNGLGRDANTLTQDEVDSFLKAEYASIPFLLLTLALVKWSISFFISELTPSGRHLLVDMGLRVLVGSWFACALIAGLFQCELPTPWAYPNNNRCINRRAWWGFVAVINIVTEIGYVALFIWIIGLLQMPFWRRLTILLIFLSRILVVAAAVAQFAVYRNGYLSSDTTGSSYLPIVLNQVVISTSIITACLPYLKPLMVSLESGIVQVPDEAELSRVASSTQRSTQLKFSEGRSRN